MRSSVKLRPAVSPETFQPRPEAPSIERPGADAHAVRGILVGCGISLAIWLVILVFVV